MQATVPGLQARWLEYHRRRTTGPDGVRDKILPLDGYVKAHGREDKYRDAYYGREYAFAGGEGLEVMTRAYQDLVGGAYVTKGASFELGTEALLRDDPEMVDMALGCLFGFEPEP